VKIPILILIAFAIVASVAKANICIEQPPGEIVCVPESPILPATQYQIFLPVIEIGE
jgi:hypothetical protein